MESMDRAALAKIFRDNKTEQALKYVEASIRMQGHRGYQKALQERIPTEKAIAKYGPMMFYQSPAAFAPSVKALTPPHIRPADTLAREKFDWMKAHPKSRPEDYETVTYPGTKSVEGSPATSGEVKTFFGLDAFAKDKPPQPAIPGIEGTPSRTRRVLIAPPSTNLTAQAAQAPPPTPPAQKPASAAPSPMPKTKSELKSGQRYITPRGEATWDGEKFVK
jgi:hypothetical protein